MASSLDFLCIIRVLLNLHRLFNIHCLYSENPRLSNMLRDCNSLLEILEEILKSLDILKSLNRPTAHFLILYNLHALFSGGLLSQNNKNILSQLHNM